jgi:hypothetical protein
VYLFAGAPKVGKSFAMAQLGYHISVGKELWGKKVRQGTVLYLALEDNNQRLQSRLSKMFCVNGNNNFCFATVAHNIGTGLEGQLEKFVNDYSNVSLIIIDTLQKVRECGNDKFSYANDYQIVTSLKKFADRFNLCLNTMLSGSNKVMLKSIYLSLITKSRNEQKRLLNLK